jgi:hypothetical protein
MRRLALALSFVALAHPLAAQSAAMKPFELNMDRVKSSDWGKQTTYFVPSYDLIISVHGSVWAQKGGAQAHGKFFVDGLDKAMLHQLASKLESDLVTKIRGAGYTVLTYADLKDHPDVAKRGLDKDDEKWGLPIRWGQPLTYVIAAPTDAQQFNNPIQGAAWPWKGIAKEKDLVAVSPEITFSVPQMWGETRAGYSSNSAGINTDPAMIFEGAMVRGINPKGGMPFIQVQRHGQRLAAEKAGTIEKLNEDKTSFSKEWKRTSGDFSMTIDPVAFSDGILRVGLAMNDLIVKEIVKAHK